MFQSDIIASLFVYAYGHFAGDARRRLLLPAGSKCCWNDDDDGWVEWRINYEWLTEES